MHVPNEIILSMISDLQSIHNKMKKSVHTYFRKFDLTPPQGMLIFLLNKNKSMKISEISKKMGLSNSTVSALVDRLEDHKMVERLRSEEDRRVVYVQLTPETSKSLISHDEVFEHMLGQALMGESQETVDHIAQSLATLNKCISKNIKEDHGC